MKYRMLLLAAGSATILASPVTTLADRDPIAGAVYIMSNEVAGNRILIFDRTADGGLAPAGSVPTGGNGTGGGLGNQGGLVLTENERWLVAVNAGSDSVSVFDVRRRGLHKQSEEPSGGNQPVSVAVHRDLVYVLNAASDSIAGFELDTHGGLSPIAGSMRHLSSAATGPAQISFTPDGRALVVTEKATNRIVTFSVGRNGLPGAARIYRSNGATPFGFAFGKRDHLLVSEAFGGAPNASAVSSYRISDDGQLGIISASVPTTETAACWVAVTPNGRFAYVTNTASGTVSGYPSTSTGRWNCSMPMGAQA